MNKIRVSIFFILIFGLLSTITAFAQSGEDNLELEAILTSDVSGEWTMQYPLGTAITDAFCVEFNGDSSQVRYGANSSSPDYPTACDNTPFNDKSGLGFVGNTGVEIVCPLPGEPDPTFNLGQFTHYNNPVFVENLGDTALDGRLKLAKLGITISGDVNTMLNFDVIFEETRNAGSSYPNTDYVEFNTNHGDVTDQCPYPLGTAPGDAAYDAVNDPDGDGTYACADRASFVNPTADDEFTDVNGNTCQVTILGFGDCASQPEFEGEVEFVTIEGQQNDSCLYATTAPPDITAVTLGQQSAGSTQSFVLVLASIVAVLGLATVITFGKSRLH